MTVFGHFVKWKLFPKNPSVMNIQYESLTPCIVQEKLMSQFKKPAEKTEGLKDGRMEVQTLIHWTLPATPGFQ